MSKRTKLHLAQQDVYYGQLMNPKSSLYNIGGYITFKGKLDTYQFKSIIKESSQVFDVFNIKFDFTGEEPLFYVKEVSVPVIIDELDFSSKQAPQKERTLFIGLFSSFNNGWNSICLILKLYNRSV